MYVPRVPVFTLDNIRDAPDESIDGVVGDLLPDPDQSVAFCHPGTAYPLWLTEAGHCPAPGGIQGPLYQYKVWQLHWGFYPVTSKQSGYCWLWHGGMGIIKMICLTRPSLTEDVTGSITFTTISPNSFTVLSSVCHWHLNEWHTCQFWCCQSSCMVLACEHTEDVGPSCHTHEICFWQFELKHAHK